MKLPYHTAIHKSVQNSFLKRLFSTAISIILASVPSILVLSGSYLIALGSTNFISEYLHINFPYRNNLPHSYFTYLGFLTMLGGISAAFFLSKKLARLGWLITLLVQGFFITIFLILFFSPLFHLTITNYLFKFGLCKIIADTVETRNLDQETEEDSQQFCTSASKLFNFKYP